MAVQKFLLFAIPVVISVCLFYYNKQLNGLPIRSAQIPEHLLHHTIDVIPNMLSEQVGDQLMDLIKQMKDFPTNANDLQFYKTKHEHVGEAVPIGADGKCSHPYLIPSQSKKECVLPGRIDVARHFMLSGGVEGIKEGYDDLVSRVQSFGRYMFNVSEFPVVDRLFASDGFQNAAKRVCPANKQVLDPFQFNFIMQVPGQTVATHVDAVYFWGATRFHVPQWLLAVMVYSGLFQEKFIDQIQVVGYVHRWENKQNPKDGAFVYWSDNEQEQYVTATPLLGNVVDGSKTVHAALIYRPEVKAPRLDKSQTNILRYIGGDNWQLLANDKVMRNYTTNDLRISIVYRARCFASKEEVDRFHANRPEDEIGLENIINTLKNDLVKRGKFSDPAAVDALPRLDLALLLMDTYIKYPMPPHAIIPYNYCMLSTLVPQLKPVLDLVCS